MLSNEEVLKQNPDLFEYEVCLTEKDSEEQIVFKCFAKNGVHALVQAENAYPGGRGMMAVRNSTYAVVLPTKH